jgi:hypothetical protein
MDYELWTAILSSFVALCPQTGQLPQLARLLSLLSVKAGAKAKAIKEINV